MGNITTSAELQKAIRTLEYEQSVKGQQLKEQFFYTFERFKPLNLIKSAFTNGDKSPNLADNLVGTATGLAGGYVSKLIVAGGSRNIFIKLLGTVLQVGVTSLVSKNPAPILAAGRFLFKKLLHRKK